MAVKFIKNLATRQEIAVKLDKNIGIAIVLLETSIKNRTPVKIGNLQGSMTGRRTGWAKGEVATKTDYAEYVEYGTSRFSARSMFRTGASDIEKRGLDIFK